MPCMCGDICCPSCGPAQGNHQCIICHEWISEGCKHYDEDGRLKPEFEKEADEIAAAERKAEEAMFKDFEESERLAAQWEREEAEHGN